MSNTSSLAQDLMKLRKLATTPAPEYEPGLKKLLEHRRKLAYQLFLDEERLDEDARREAYAAINQVNKMILDFLGI